MLASERSESDRVVDELLSRGLIEPREGRLRTTRRWQAAMARAAYALLSRSGDGEDLRVPIVAALIELCGDDVSDDRLVEYVAAMLPIERQELDPRAHFDPG